MNAENSSTSSSIPPQPFLLSTPGDLKPAVTVGMGLPARVSGMPAFYYWKDAIVVGSYAHPAGKFTLNITRDKLDGYAENFKRMKSNGVGVPILMDHAQSAAATLGWILDVTRRGDRLLELHQFLGEDARDIGLRNLVSLGIDPNFVDGKGNRYGEAIVHSAVTPVPVVPGQDGFEPVDEAVKDLVMLSLREGTKADAPHLAPREDTPGLCGADESVVEPNDNPPCIHGGLNGGISELALNALADAAAAKRDLAIARGGVDPAVAEELFALLVQTPGGSLNTITLSRQSADTAPLALAVFDALSRNQPTPMGETTQLQILSRNIPGLDADRLDLQQRMIALASGQAL